VVSMGRCNTGLKFLSWRLILQGLSWSLVELASDYIQGFGVARPMPASEIPQWMDTLNPKRQLPPRRKRANSFSKS
jgi:hypothetical protein